MERASLPESSPRKPVHLRKVGVAAVTGVTLAAAVVVYERQRRQRRNLEQYIAKGDIFDLEATEPSAEAQQLRQVAAVILTRPDGITMQELRGLVDKNLFRHSSMGPALHLLARTDMLMAVGGTSRNQIVAPHPDFLRAIVTAPSTWEPLLLLAAAKDEAFTIEQFMPHLPGEEF